ncbi:hypothetical protein LXL04_006232 [Taraxacum kok-saghyz]
MNNQHILGLATNSSIQIPPINIKLETSNYCLWRTTIISAFETFDLESFILNPTPPPETITVPRENAEPRLDANPAYQLWKKRDRYVLLWLKSTLAERALAIVARCSSSHLAWTSIEKTFQAQTRASCMAMKTQLQTLSKGSLSMIEYVEKKRSIADSLAENLTPISTEDLIGYILSGLDSSYGSFTYAVMMKEDIASIDDLVGLLLQEEARLEHEHLCQSLAVPPPANTAAPMALHVQRPQQRFSSAPTGSTTAQSSGGRPTDPRRRRPHCQLCNKPGYEAVDCWQRSNMVDYPSRKPNPRAPPSRQAHTAQYHSHSTAVDPSWYLDSGATDHIAPDFSKLNIVEEYHGSDTLQVGNGTHLPISHIASTSIYNLQLPSVLIVPHITKRLISASKLTKDNNMYLELWPNRCIVKTLQGKILLNGDVHDGLYRLPFPINKAFNKSPSAVALTGVRTSLHGWHKRLAHPHAPLLKHLISSFALPLSSNNFPNVCDACHLGKNIKQIQTDWDGDYRNFTTYINNHGIGHRVSCPYTQEQNGAIECRNRVLYNKTLDYGFLKTFACLCFPFLRPYNSHKIDFRSKPCVFIGYSASHKGYLCYHQPTSRIYIARHVVFDEDVFPYTSPILSSTPNSSSPSTSTSMTILHQAEIPSPSPLPINTPTSTPSVSLHTPTSTSSSTSTSTTNPHYQRSTICSRAHRNSPPPSRPSAPTRHPMVTRTQTNSLKPKTFTSTLSSSDPIESSTFKQAVTSPCWQEAMKCEYDALMKNKTWKLVPCPSNVNVVGCKWIYRIKRKLDGSIDRYKARLVAQGYSQAAGIDYFETFSPVIKPTTIRLVLSLTISQKWSIRQLDINNAFLNGDLVEDVYMRQPRGFEDNTRPSHVCQLTKAIYGNNASFIQNFINQLHKAFALKDMGDLHFFLGIQIDRKGYEVTLSQEHYIQNILLKTKMSDASPMSTPADSQTRLTLDGDPFPDPTLYRQVVGSLQYATITRPDIAYAVNRVCQYMHSPTTRHWQTVKRILRYLKGTIHHCLHFTPTTATSLLAYSDAGWLSDKDDSRSQYGFAVFHGSNLISWTSRKQKIFAFSTRRTLVRRGATFEIVAQATEGNEELENGGVRWCARGDFVATSAPRSPRAMYSIIHMV